MAPDGTGLQLLTRNASSAAVSPDGRRIAFVRDGALWQMRRDGTGQRQLTRPRPNGDWDLAWSPDRRTVYFSRSVHGGAIFSIRDDGTGVRCLSPSCRRTGRTEDDAAPSPDGRIVAYSHSFHEGGEDASFLVAMRPDGRRATLDFPDFAGTHQFDPAWAPDGRRIAFAALDADAMGERGYEQQLVGSPGIYVAARGASSPRRSARPSAWGAFLDPPAWSADGRWIAFTHDDGNRRTDIWLGRSEGAAVRRVTSGTSDDGEPAWLPPAS